MISIYPLLDGSEKEMNKNGSVTPKSYGYTATEITKVLSLSLLIIDEGSTSTDKFGALSALQSGVLIQAVLGGVTKTIATLKDNGDIVNACDRNSFGSSAVLSVLGISTPQGFLDSNDAFIGEIILGEISEISPLDIILQADDVIKAVVQDNLTGLNFFRISVKVGTS